MIPFDRLRMTSYWRSIVTMALSGVVSEKHGNIGADSQFSPAPLFDDPWRRTCQIFLAIFGFAKLE